MSETSRPARPARATGPHAEIDAAPMRIRRSLICAIIALCAAWAGALRDGFRSPLAPDWVLIVLQIVQLAVLAVGLSALNEHGRYRSAKAILAAWGTACIPPRVRRAPAGIVPPTGLDAFVLLLLPLLAALAGVFGLFVLARGLLDAAALLASLMAMARLGLHLFRRINAPQLLLPTTFALLIGFGTLLLMLPKASVGKPMDWIDALFTATSAVCVTGLTVRSTAEEFSTAGQSAIALMIQLGGLGIVVFGATFAALLRGTLSLREHVTVRDMLEHHSVSQLRRFVLMVVGLTLLLQLIAAAAMYALWSDAPGAGMGARERLGMSLFHSISAFCNAGFDLTGDSLVGHRRSALALAVIAPLVIIGGIGFPVLFDLGRWIRERLAYALNRRKSVPARLNLHSRLTIRTTLFLIMAGWVLVLVGQAGRGGLGAGSLGDAWFMSVSARTAGFNTIPMDELTPASSFSLMALMCIGGSPGSTAGGLKTTTLAVLALATLASIRGRNETESGTRSIPEAVVRKAGAIALCMLGLIVVSTVLLCLIEHHMDPFKLLFEVVSAATTTGLSLGVTPELSTAGKLVLVATMFLGRVGPLTLLGVLVLRRPPARAYLYPRETVTLG